MGSIAHVWCCPVMATPLSLLFHSPFPWGGWKAPYSTMLTETACNLANQAMSQHGRFPEHRLEASANTPPAEHSEVLVPTSWQIDKTHNSRELLKRRHPSLRLTRTSMIFCWRRKPSGTSAGSYAPLCMRLMRCFDHSTPATPATPPYAERQSW
jgi:hypothetical protein